MQNVMKYCVYKEAPYYVAQCLNVDVSSFGDTATEAIENLKEALELYLEDASPEAYQEIDEVMIGEKKLYA